jgi:hypothetical protein
MSTDEEPPDSERQAWLRWGTLGWAQRHWLRRSLRAIHLFDWLRESDRYTAMLGADGYRAQMLEWLAAAVPEDCAAAGLHLDGAIASLVSDTLELSVHFSPARSHRAVAWREAAWPAARVWIDGAPPDGIVGDPPGYWADEDRYSIAIAGPAGHPQQDHAMFGGALGRVHSLLIWDARARRPHSLQEPQAHEDWTQPIAVVREGALHIHADAQAAATRPADRVVPL